MITALLFLCMGGKERKINFLAIKTTKTRNPEAIASFVQVILEDKIMIMGEERCVLILFKNLMTLKLHLLCILSLKIRSSLLG